MGSHAAAGDGLPPEVSTALAAGDAMALAALATSAEAKAVRKAAKRALHLLRLRGIVPPPGERLAAPAARAEKAPASTGDSAREPARITTISGQGDRVLFLPVKAPLGFALHTLVLSEREGVREVDTVQVSRKQLRAALDELPAAMRHLLREVPQARAVALVREALGASQASTHAARARELLRSLPETPEPEADAPLSEPASEPSAKPSNAEAASALAASAALLETGPFADSFPTREALEALDARLGEIAVSPLYLDERQRGAQRRHSVERAIASHFEGDLRARYAVRLSDAAELFDDRGDGANAARARATAAALREGRDALEIPFARALFERLLSPEAGGAPEAAAKPAAAPPGKLILP